VPPPVPRPAAGAEVSCITGSPCRDPTCYRGGIGDWNYQFKDGPCGATGCMWPPGLAARPHFTDTPSPPVVDAGKAALAWRRRVNKRGFGACAVVCQRTGLKYPCNECNT